MTILALAEGVVGFLAYSSREEVRGEIKGRRGAAEWKLNKSELYLKKTLLF